MVLMNSKKSKGVTRIAVAGIAAAVISFTLTGVAENAVSGALQGKDIASGLKRLTVLSATLAMPIGNYDGNENNISNDTASQDKPQSSAGGTSSAGETEQASGNESMSEPNTPSVTESEPTESLVPALAPVESRTGLISLNIRKDKDDLASYTAKDGATEEKHYGKITGDNVIDLEHGQVRNCTKISNNVLLTEGTKRPEIKIDGGNEPQVLIIHTHTTESYERDSDGYYDTAYQGDRCVLQTVW